MDYRELIKGKISKIASKGYVSGSVAPNISEKVLNNSISTIAIGLDPEYVIAILDQSILKTGKEGVLFSGDALYYKGSFETPEKIKYNNINKVVEDNREKTKKNGTLVLIPGIKIYLKDGGEISLPDSIAANIDTGAFVELMDEIVDQDEEVLINQSETMPLQEMSDEIKEIYVKILCNYAFSGDHLIDSKEYAEIISFIVRIEMSTESRINIRSYINEINDLEDLDSLLGRIRELTNPNEFVTISKSVVKDIISLFMIENDGEDWHQDPFIAGIASELEVERIEIELFILTIENNKKIIEGRLNDSQVTKTLKDLSTRAASVGVPMAVLYFSGTVGVSAAGMTSGLATLGLGGILGFSSMFTGVGALALIGITSYHGLKKIAGMKDTNNNRNREILLQEIMKNTQKSLTYLIEDINTISSKLAEEVSRSDLNEEKIKKLANILKNASKGSEVTVNKANYYSSEKILVKAPKTIDELKINEMTKEPTLLPLRESIFVAYHKNEDNKLELNELVTVDEANQLISSLEKIGFYNLTDNTTAQVKSTAKNIFNSLKN